MRWRDAAFVLGLSGVAGLKEAAVLRFLPAPPISPSRRASASSTQLNGIHAKLAAPDPCPGPEQPPGVRLHGRSRFNGSVSLSLAPVARETRSVALLRLAAPEFLPAASCRTSARSRPQGFTAAWKVPHLAAACRRPGASPRTGLERLQPYAFGVTMIAPVDFYSLVNRAAKYGILFLALAFMAVFCLELISGGACTRCSIFHRPRAGLLLRAPAVAGGAPGVPACLPRGLRRHGPMLAYVGAAM